MMAMIFISGAAGVGKSTVIKNLKTNLPKESFSLHDIDESDLWNHDYKAWKIAKIDYWLQRSKSNNQFEIDTILCGIVSPNDVSAAQSFSDGLPIKYILLHASPEILASRLLSKFGTEEKRASFDEKKVKRITSFVQGHIATSKKLLEVFQNHPQSLVLDTTESSAIEIFEKVKDYLLLQQ